MIATSSCDSEDKTLSNPLLERSWDTPYGIAPFGKISPRDYMPAFEMAFAQQDEIVERIVADTLDATFESVILALDNSDIWITDLFNIFTMVEASSSSDELAKVNAELMPRLSMQQDKILLNQELFARVKSFYDVREGAGLDKTQLRLVEKSYDKFVRAGALLDEESRSRLIEINSEIAELRVRFSQNLLGENASYALELTRTQLDGLPAMFRSEALREARSRGLSNKWAITLNSTSIIPFLTYSTSRELREEIFKAYISRGKRDNEFDNRGIVKRTSELRLERAKVLGYKNHAEYVTSAQMAQSPEAAYELIDSIFTSSMQLAQRDLKRMERRFDKDYPDESFEAWDWWKYVEDIRSRDYSLKDESVRGYFPVEGVRSGAFLLANRLYGITFRPIIIPQYADNCFAYEVVDASGVKLGLLHMDLYTRPTKGQGAWCGFLREQRYEDGVRVLPIVSISCNFMTPREADKSLLSMVEVETLFHEFGHALHFIFRDSKYRGLGEVEGDFVELPSQIMERWAFEPEMLKLYALHHTTGVGMPANIIRGITRSRNFNAGFQHLEAAAAALLDLDLHTLDDFEYFDVDIFEMNSLYTKRSLISEVEPRYHLTYFPHIFTFDYASGYYFYLWAEALEREIFEEFKSSGDLFNRELATKFRREILERGGSLSGEEMYRNFMGDRMIKKTQEEELAEEESQITTDEQSTNEDKELTNENR